MRFKLKKLWRISVYDRKTNKLVFQTMPSASLKDQQQQLLRDAWYCIDYKGNKAITNFFHEDFEWQGKIEKGFDHIAVVERIECAYTPYLETTCKK